MEGIDFRWRNIAKYMENFRALGQRVTHYKGNTVVM